LAKLVQLPDPELSVATNHVDDVAPAGAVTPSTPIPVPHIANNAAAAKVSNRGQRWLEIGAAARRDGRFMAKVNQVDPRKTRISCRRRDLSGWSYRLTLTPRR
jgi:hypothetical protein